VETKKELKVALACDWLTGIGGAERVLLELHHLYPEAPIYTSQYDPKGIDWFKNADVRTGWLQHIPSSLKKFLPILRAIYFSQLNLNTYDLVISASGAEAKGIKTSSSTTHVSYIHSPTHYYWSRYDDYIKNPGFGAFNWLARLGLKVFVKPMRNWDKKAAQRPDYLIANSTHTKKMIKKYYNRDSKVIFPPVDIDRFKNDNRQTRKGLVIAGRQTPYKRIDLAVEACTNLNIPLTVIGDGPENKKIKAIAGKNITFIKRLNDKEIIKYFSNSKGFIFPGLDDFGIVAVEALSAGTPVIAYKAGGVLDYIKENKNGLFFSEQTKNSLTKALIKFNSMIFDHKKIQESAQMFGSKNFKDSISNFIKSLED
jgi:glycosyltransferase involved in cell wall biosynthesis